MRTLPALLGAAVMLGLAVPPAPADEPEPITIAAVGDIACDPDEPAYNNGWGTPAGCQQRAVGDAVRSLNPQAFLPLGDLQYIDGTYDKFMTVYDKAFGDLKPITRPIPGNHEYKTAGGAGYYQYFGAAAHQQAKGTYSFTLGSWHIIGINSTTCTAANPCGPGSPMAKWIAADVAANPSQCLMAMWHHPIWSAGDKGGYAPMLPVWNQLHGYGADVVLNGHDHLYQRSNPLGPGSFNPDGTVADPVIDPDGMVEFIVGTGGENNFEARNLGNPAINAAMAAVDTNPNPAVFGPLRMDLGTDGYTFEFIPAAGSKPFIESGSAACRTKTPPLDAPTRPTDLRVTRAGDGKVSVTWSGGDAATSSVTSTVSVLGTARKCVTTTQNCTVTGLTNGRSYQVSVTADNAVGRITSDPSAPFVPAVRPSRTGVPTATVSGGLVTLNWAATSYDGGLPVHYVARSSTGGATCTTTGLSCTMTVPPGTYRFGVLARNEVGDSATQTTASTVTVPPPKAPSVAGLARAGDGAVKVTVSAAPDEAYSILSYLVKSSPAGKTCTITAPATSCTVTGLTNGTSYTFSATARAASVNSAASAPSAPLVVGRVPVRLAAATVSPSGPGTVTLTWAPTTYDGGLPVSGYEAIIGNGPTIVCRTTALTCTADGLTTGTKYWFTIVAINEAGRSANSPGSPVITAG